jgi:hypothetical protein
MDFDDQSDFSELIQYEIFRPQHCSYETLEDVWKSESLQVSTILVKIFCHIIISTWEPFLRFFHHSEMDLRCWTLLYATSQITIETLLCHDTSNKPFHYIPVLPPSCVSHTYFHLKIQKPQIKNEHFLLWRKFKTKKLNK